MSNWTIPIQSGQLQLAIRRAEWPLESSVTFATRQNPRRLYLFVSKLLGKHWPVRPSLMQAAQQKLAEKIAHLPGPLVLIGLAETATALGRGVAEEAAEQTGRNDLLYLQTTRVLYRIISLFSSMNPIVTPRIMQCIGRFQRCGLGSKQRELWYWWMMKSPLAGPWLNWHVPICRSTPASNRWRWFV